MQDEAQHERCTADAHADFNNKTARLHCICTSPKKNPNKTQNVHQTHQRYRIRLEIFCQLPFTTSTVHFNRIIV